MKKVLIVLVLVALMVVSVAPPAMAGAATNWALGLSAFAVANQIFGGVGVFHHRDRVVIVERHRYPPPPVVIYEREWYPQPPVVVIERHRGHESPADSGWYCGHHTSNPSDFRDCVQNHRGGPPVYYRR